MATLNIDQSLETTCWQCDASGVSSDTRWNDENGRCCQCDGTGYKNTELGDELMAFLARRGITK